MVAKIRSEFRGKTRAVVLGIFGVALMVIALLLEQQIQSQFKALLDSIGIGFITVGVIAYFYDEALSRELRADFFTTVLKEHAKTDGVASAIESIPLNVRWLRKNLLLEYELSLDAETGLMSLVHNMEYDLENRTLEPMKHDLRHYLAPDPSLDEEKAPEFTVYTCRIKDKSSDTRIRNWGKGEPVPEGVKIESVDVPYDGTVQLIDQIPLEPYNLPGSEVRVRIRGLRVASPKEYERWSATAITENIVLKVRYAKDLEISVSLQHPNREWTLKDQYSEELLNVAIFELDQVFLPYQGFLLKWNPLLAAAGQEV